MDLVERCQQDAHEEHRPRRLDVAPDVLEKAHQQIWVYVPDRALVKAGEVEEGLILAAVEDAD